MAIPGNFLSATTEAVDPDTSGWTALINCTKSLGTGGRIGDGTLVLTSVASGEIQAESTSVYPVVEGVLYEAFADAASSTQPERIGILWLDDRLSQVGSISWSLTTATASATLHRIAVADAAPLAATHARVLLDATTTAAARTAAFENVYLGLPQRTSGNLFDINTETIEVNGFGWTADVNSTVARTAPAVQWPVDEYTVGGHVITMTATANGNASMRTATRPAVEVGREYVGWAYLNPPTSGATTWVEIRWYNSSGTQLSAKRATVGQPGTGWYQQFVSGVAPTGTVSCSLAAGVDSATAGQKLSVDGAVVLLASGVAAPGTVMSYEDASFEQGVGQWTVSSGVATIARSGWTTSAADGYHTLTVSSSTATTSVLKSGRYPVTPGVNWRPSLAATVTSGGTWSVSPNVRWYDAGGTQISVSSVAASTVPADGTWWIVSDDITAPAGAATAQIEVSAAPTSGSATLQVDTALLVQALPDFEATADSGLGRVVLVLRELTALDTLTLYRIVGGTQALVRGSDGLVHGTVLTGSQLVVEDYEAPMGAPVTYRALIRSADGITSSNRLTAPVMLSLPDPSDCWVKDPIEPYRNVMLRASAAPDWTRPIEQTVYRIRNRRNSVVLSDVRGGLTGTLQVWTQSDQEREALHFALDTGNPLLLQFSPNLGLDDTYVAVADATEARLVPYATELRRLWQLPLTQVDQPIGGVVGTAGWTVQDLATTVATILDVVSSYATVLDLALNQQEA